MGKTVISIIGTNAGDEEFIMECSDGTRIRFFHQQDCCENVSIDQIDGHITHLIGSPIIMAEEVSEEGPTSEYGDSSTWTFYKFATMNGYVTVKWLGTSNGYYSESVGYVWE